MIRLCPVFRSPARSLAALLFAFAPVPSQSAPDPQLETRFFDEQVLPILEQNCFKCHGAEDKLRGDLRLTSREGLLHGGAHGPSIKLENPDASFLLEVVNYAVEGYEMPPKGKLPPEEIDILTRWIRQGASYNPEREIKGHLVKRGSHIQPEDFSYWAYRPVIRPEPPLAGANGPDAVDAFLAAALQTRDLEPNPRASRRALIRRATYDLTGLPPTIEEVETFAADPRPHETAWAELIDDLLNRPQYGEKWARHWLDLVRYAETNGFERDNPKPEIWRYRDYVVDAFNQDLPYDRFIIDQLAGDELPEPSLASLAATGYHRLMQWDDEPADGKQHVYDVLADNVAITSETFLGTTLGCARCHDHKADPVTQRDFFSFMAFFHGLTPYRTEGSMLAWSSDAERRAFDSERRDRIAALEGEIAAIEERLLPWLTSQTTTSSPSPDADTMLVSDARSRPVTWDFTTSRPPQDWMTVGFRDKSWTTALSGFGRPGTPGAIASTIWDTEEIWLRTAFGLQSLPQELTLHIHHAASARVFLNGHLIYEAEGHLENYTTVPLGPKALDALQTGRNVIAVHGRQVPGAQFIDLGLRSGPGAIPGVEQALQTGGPRLAKAIEAEFGTDLAAQRRDLLERLTSWRARKPGVSVNAATEFDTPPRPLHIHIRGNAHATGDSVEPAFPGVLHARFDPVPATIVPPGGPYPSSGRRLALARWIASPENPLTARVMVNRLWQHHFGTGLVATASDFGKLGEAPSHPELLDWLAAEFVARGWSLKEMHRLLMHTEAYQRSSAPDDASLAIDPSNRLLWRASMRRLTGEEIRDSMLAVSGSLNLDLGGPWVTPPLPEAVLATASRPDRSWPATSGAAANRRSLYVHVKRSLRVPLLVDFDQADTDTACAVRFSTTVPTQALGMLNSEFVNDQAAALAARLSTAFDQTEDRVREGLRFVTQRPPSPDQIDEALAMIDQLRAAGTSEATALERFALLALNLNEFVYLD